MRWPIQVQLLLPMLLIVLLAIVLASGATAYWAAARARADQEEALRRVTRTLTEASFPLTEKVLSQLSGLSGADFVVLSNDGRLRESTLRLDAADLERLTERAEQTAEPGPPQRTVDLGGRAYLVQRVRLDGRSPSTTSGILWILHREDLRSARMQQAMTPAIISGLIAALVAAATTVLLAGRLVRPIHDLVRRTAAIAGGDFAPAAASRRNDELRDLEDSVNRMAERLGQYETEIRRTERLQTLGKMGAGMAHQLRNAATGGRIAVELHARQCPLRRSDESLDVALRQFRLMESFLQRFLALGRPTGGERVPVPAAALVADVLDLLRPTAGHLGIRLECPEPPEPLDLLGDPAAVRQLLGNLILNACEAAKDGAAGQARVVVAIARCSKTRGEIRVSDTGPGPPETVAQRLFEPFVTGKPEGMGLGLFVARQIAEAHGGTLTWERRGATTCFRFQFPLHHA